MRYLSILLTLVTITVNAQTGYYFASFKNKANNSYSLSTPAAFLSARALQRRNHQSIAIDSLDLPVSNAYVNQITGAGILVHAVSKWLNGVIVRIENSQQYSTLSGFSFVKNMTYLKPLIPVKSTIEKFSHEKNYVYGYATNQIQMLNGDYLHNLGNHGEGMLIAILDAGFLGADTISYFDSLRMQNRIVLTRDIVDGFYDTYVYESHVHGTMVLSTMATLSDGNFVGTAPKASYALIRTEDGATEYRFEEYTWAIGAELADSIGADVINSSLGYSTFDDSTMNYTWADLNGRTSVASRAATICARKGMISTISAGNSGDDVWRKISVPGDADSILTAGAVDSHGIYAFFSSQGYSADGRVKPDVATQGMGCAVVDDAGNVTSGSGTSFSSPILCGLVTCLWQSNPTKKNMEILKAVRQSASQYQHPDSLLGYGIPNFEQAYFILTGIKPLTNNPFEIKGIYPNPCETTCHLYYTSDKQENITIQLFSVDGKLVFKQNTTLQPSDKGAVSFSLKDIKQGFYILSVKSDMDTHSFSLIRN
jgi:hypothetical protein